jgi:hypothetical protein
MVAGILMNEASVEFCEHCGISREKLGRDHVRPGSERLLRACGGCDATCCPNCWNVRADRCLLCVPFFVPVAAMPPEQRRPVPRLRVPAKGGVASGGPTAATPVRAATLAGIRRSLLAVGYVLVAVLILTRSPFFLSASASDGTTPIESPSVDVPGPARSSPTEVPANAGSPAPGEPSPTPSTSGH